MYGEYWTGTVEAMLDGDRGGHTGCRRVNGKTSRERVYRNFRRHRGGKRSFGGVPHERCFLGLRVGVFIAFRRPNGMHHPA